MLHPLRLLTAGLLLLAAVNVALLAVIGHYDLRLGPLHLVATYLFKPLLYLNGAFLLALAVRPAPAAVSATGQGHPTALGPRFWIPAIAIMAAVYGVSFGINLLHPEWTHRPLTTGMEVWRYFTERQYDGYYRPLTFLSLRLDHAVFGEALWGYHVQNILLHLLNGFLVARLACRLELGITAARWAGLLFIALPASFEAVIWPGARFDLLAATFLLVALDLGLAGSVVLSTVAYACGVLAKESAYCYPLLLGTLILLRRPLGLSLDRARIVRVLLAAVAVTVVLLGLRVVVYGNLGGYPDEASGKSVNFVLNVRSFTSLFTRVPAAVYLVNSVAELTWWLRAALLAYAGVLVAALISGAGLGARAVLLLLPFLAAVPALNVIGWLNHYAGGGRYVYQSAIWVVLAVATALAGARHSRLLAGTLVASMAAAALFNTLAYVRLTGTVERVVEKAALACRNAPCCQTLVFQRFPRDLDGATFFRDQVHRRTQQALPNVEVLPGAETGVDGPCSITLDWEARKTWLDRQ